jgi:hypothetical protein
MPSLASGFGFKIRRVQVSLMTTPQDVLSVANEFIGYCEKGGCNRTYFGDWYDEKDITHDQWCAMFVSYCFYVSGLPLPAETRKGFKYNPSGASWFKEHGMFHSTPRVGDVIFIDRFKGYPPCRTPEEDNCSDAWHVGIVEAIDSEDRVTTIEGNENDQVMRRQRSSDDWYGFGRPEYDGKPLPPTEPGYPKYPGKFMKLCTPPMSSDSIAIWKQRMIERGFRFSGDIRTFDQETRDALCEFQRLKHLDPDGVLGPISWRAVWELPIVV